MELSTAIRLIEKGMIANVSGQCWADLGAGKGLFTRALSSLLPSGSLIHAIDKNKEAINSIELFEHVRLKPISADIEQPLGLHDLDGIIMANVIHFVKEKASFIEQIKTYIRPDAHVLVIEYDTVKANQWVPYPIAFRALSEMVVSNGFTHVTKIGEEPSRYGMGNIYSALIT